MNSNERTNLSKTLSKLLRHKAVDEGLTIRSDGFISLSSILARPKLQKLGATRERVEEVVLKDAKTRFTLREEADGEYYIRANQGHSLIVEDLELTELDDPSLYPVVLHGTFRDKWPDIKASGGLRVMTRQHIHLATGRYGDRDIKSGIRKSCNLFIYIDLSKAIADGITFMVSSNGVILTSGVNGLLATCYFSRVETSEGELLLPELSQLTLDRAHEEPSETARRELFGGCLSTLMPPTFLDASQFRQVPDSQEVLLDPSDAEVSFIVEVVERLDVPDEAAIAKHFGILGDDNEATDLKISSIEDLSQRDADADARSAARWLCRGTQRAKKFNSREAKDVPITMGLVRLPTVATDVLLTLHGGSLEVAHARMRQAVEGFRVDDWRLFPEEAEPGYATWA